MNTYVSSNHRLVAAIGIEGIARNRRCEHAENVKRVAMLASERGRAQHACYEEIGLVT